ncbi:hypothetical protein XCY_001844 [Xanthomonas arboricola pv. juglandis]|uniref:phage regulatory CII family protein n=1 Tax=Xanthomonas arboricola TaxID=56448 RepID=UPI001AFB46B5|nr:phage regulatory CII family protein [Xanthomonas arboricola]CAG2089129.1 hypothetical protein XCY_001844 [Xanthomonas arboricola pv. juglandis]
MNIHVAALHTVKLYPGGAEALAPSLLTRNRQGEPHQMSGAMLRNKVNINSSAHHLTWAEADQILSVTGDHRMLHALAGEHGYVLQKIDPETSGSLMDGFLSVSAVKGAIAVELSEMLADLMVSSNEAANFEQLCLKGQAALVRLAALGRAAAEAGAR